jgi:hypothetical protein
MGGLTAAERGQLARCDLSSGGPTLRRLKRRRKCRPTLPRSSAHGRVVSRQGAIESEQLERDLLRRKRQEEDTLADDIRSPSAPTVARCIYPSEACSRASVFSGMAVMVGPTPRPVTPSLNSRIP